MKKGLLTYLLLFATLISGGVFAAAAIDEAADDSSFKEPIVPYCTENSTNVSCSCLGGVPAVMIWSKWWAWASPTTTYASPYFFRNGTHTDNWRYATPSEWVNKPSVAAGHFGNPTENHPDYPYEYSVEMCAAHLFNQFYDYCDYNHGYNNFVARTPAEAPQNYYELWFVHDLCDRFPDLVPIVVQAPSQVNVGQNFNVVLNISNIGNGSSGSTNVTYNFSGNIVDFVIPQLSPNQINTTTLTMMCFYPGINYLKIKVDSPGWLTELNEGNNEVSVPINCTGSAAPMVSSVSVTPQQPTRANSIYCNVTVFSFGPPTLTVYYEWYKNGTNQTSLAGVAYNVPHNTPIALSSISPSYFKKDQNWSCRVRAYDGALYSPWQMSPNTTIANFPVSIRSIYTRGGGWPPPDPFMHHYTEIVAEVVDYDIDYNASEVDILYANWNITEGSNCYVWFGGICGESCAILGRGCWNDIPLTLYVHLNVTDRSGAFSEMSAGPFEYFDYPPLITQPTLSSPLYPNSTAVCQAGTFSDPDSDEENLSARTFTWYKNNIEVANGHDNTLQLSSIGAQTGDEIYCKQTSYNMYWPGSASNTSQVVVVSPPEGSISYNSGWNLISLPVIPENNSSSAVWPEGTSLLYAYENGYVPVNEVANGKGYWLKFGSPVYRIYQGTPVTTVNTSIRQGWNIIGTPSSPVLLANVRTEPEGILASDFFGFDGSSYQKITTQLMPGRGYWVKASQAGRLILDNSKAGKFKPTDTSGMGAVQVSDSKAASMSVFLGTSARPDLPPRMSGFDVRYSTDRYIEALPASGYKDYTIVVTSAAYPIKVSWQLNSGYSYTLSYVSGGKMQSMSLPLIGSVTIADPSVTKLTLRATKSASSTITQTPSTPAQ
ncbi:MAG: hypothetical protein N3G22_04620 [Candidatus Micrarchaeota archaeon]|nr:hypothetical protein [Candidatus Micrarchaeota archaeon]